MFSRGAVATFAILGLGAVMAGAAVWYQSRESRLCRLTWGAANTYLVRHAPQVEVLQLGAVERLSDPTPAELPDETRDQTTAPPDPVLDVDGRRLLIEHALDISRTRGLVHARHALIVDHNYEAPTHDEPRGEDWRFALRFTDGPNRATLLLDPTHHVVCLLENGRRLQLRAETMRVEVALLQRELDAALPPPGR